MTTEASEVRKTPKITSKRRKMNQIKEIFKQELPHCFRSGSDKLPLKIGIHIEVHTHYKDDLRFTPQLIQYSLNSYCRTPAYLSKIIAGASRVDIHGNPAGQVTAEEENHAKDKLKIILKLQEKNLRDSQVIETLKQKPAPHANSLPSAKPLLTPSKITPTKATPLPPTKEEIKKAKQEKYAKKVARRKEFFKK